jgi:hypothetical protein
MKMMKGRVRQDRQRPQKVMVKLFQASYKIVNLCSTQSEKD